MSEDDLEMIGQLADSLDSALYPLRLPIPDHVKIDGMASVMRDVRDKLVEIVRRNGDDPWPGHDLEG